MWRAARPNCGYLLRARGQRRVEWHRKYRAARDVRLRMTLPGTAALFILDVAPRVAASAARSLVRMPDTPNLEPRAAVLEEIARYLRRRWRYSGRASRDAARTAR